MTVLPSLLICGSVAVRISQIVSVFKPGFAANSVAPAARIKASLCMVCSLFVAVHHKCDCMWAGCHLARRWSIFATKRVANPGPLGHRPYLKLETSAGRGNRHFQRGEMIGRSGEYIIWKSAVTEHIAVNEDRLIVIQTHACQILQTHAEIVVDRRAFKPRRKIAGAAGVGREQTDRGRERGF